MPVNIQLSKISIAVSNQLNQLRLSKLLMLILIVGGPG